MINFLVANFFKKLASYAGHLRNEYWLLPDGTLEDANGDIGDNNHETIAVDYFYETYLDRDEIYDAAKEIFNSNNLNKLKDLLSDEDIYLSQVAAELNEFRFFEDMLIKALSNAGKSDIAKLYKEDPRIAYSAITGAIRIVNNEFFVYDLNSNALELIQNFLMENEINEELDVDIESGKNDYNVKITVHQVLMANSVMDLKKFHKQNSTPKSPSIFKQNL